MVLRRIRERWSTRRASVDGFVCILRCVTRAQRPMDWAGVMGGDDGSWALG